MNINLSEFSKVIEMKQADVSKLVSQLRIKVNPTHRRLKNPKGPEGRHDIIRKILTGLFKYERIELIYTKADEARGYAERVSFLIPTRLCKGGNQNKHKMYKFSSVMHGENVLCRR